MTTTTGTHYETLGVSKTASQDEIKRAFRKLSMECHPDLHPDACGNRFKTISNAHSVLSNAAERKLYDSQLAEDRMWKQQRQYQHPRNGGGARRPHKPHGHVVMETLTNPRFFVAGIVGLGGVALLGSLLGGLSSKRPEYYHQQRGESSLVEAWKNPATGRYEQPAPWDKTYQRLRPKLEMVPREQVTKRSM